MNRLEEPGRPQGIAPTIHEPSGQHRRIVGAIPCGRPGKMSYLTPIERSLVIMPLLLGHRRHLLQLLIISIAIKQVGTLDLCG